MTEGAISSPAAQPPSARARSDLLDPTDVRILQVLEEDGRASVSHIAREVGLTDNAVRHRLRRLRTSGVLRKVTVHVDPVQLGQRRAALVLLQLEHGTNLAPLRAHPRLALVIATRGQFQAAALVVARDSDDLDQFLADELRQMAGVRAVLALDVHPGAELPVQPSACGLALPQRARS